MGKYIAIADFICGIGCFISYISNPTTWFGIFSLWLSGYMVAFGVCFLMK